LKIVRAHPGPNAADRLRRDGGRRCLRRNGRRRQRDGARGRQTFPAALGRPHANVGDVTASLWRILKKEESPILRQGAGSQYGIGVGQRPEPPFRRRRCRGRRLAGLLPTEQQGARVASGQPNGRCGSCQCGSAWARFSNRRLQNHRIALQKDGRYLGQPLGNAFRVQLRCHQMLDPGQFSECRHPRFGLRRWRKVRLETLPNPPPPGHLFSNLNRRGHRGYGATGGASPGVFRAADKHKSQRCRSPFSHEPLHWIRAAATHLQHRESGAKTPQERLRDGIGAESRFESADGSRIRSRRLLRARDTTTRGRAGHLLHGEIRSSRTWVQSDRQAEDWNSVG
jgi:hypothetical protein